MTSTSKKSSLRLALFTAAALLGAQLQAAELTPADYTAIQQLYARYNYTIDHGDGEGWELLIALTSELGFDELTQQFRQALVIEEEHAIKVRAWLLASVLGQSGAEPSDARDEHVTA